MARQEGQLSVRELLQSLSERLLAVLMGDARKFALSSNGPITIEIYLAALYRSFPDEVGAFFSSREPLAQMAEKLSSVDISPHEIEPTSRPGDPARVLNVKMHEGLVRLLSRAAKTPSDSGKGRADLVDLMGALSVDDETVARLQKERNLTPKGYLRS